MLAFNKINNDKIKTLTFSVSVNIKEGIIKNIS